jgi:hypothetical protein
MKQAANRGSESLPAFRRNLSPTWQETSLERLLVYRLTSCRPGRWRQSVPPNHRLTINDHTVLYPGRFRNSRCSKACTRIQNFILFSTHVHGIVTCNVDFFGTISYAVAWGGWILLIATEIRTVVQWRGVFWCHYSFWLLPSDVVKSRILSQLFIRLTPRPFQSISPCIARGSNYTNSKFINWSKCNEPNNSSESKK